VPAGFGQVDWDRFFRLLTDAGYDGHLTIEREVVDGRLGDIARARDLIVRYLSGGGPAGSRS
jgi:sugar phosphate isomerase/epimerase